MTPTRPGKQAAISPNPTLEMARRHVAEAEARIERQRGLLARMEQAGQPTDLARELLSSLIEIKAQMQVHRDLLEAQEKGT